MNTLLSSYSKEQFGDYIIENSPELKVQFKDYVLEDKRFTDESIPVLALMTLYPETFKKELKKCLRTMHKIEQQGEDFVKSFDAG